jgi:NADP-dependent 3-hydroxy acid dehydrogenase YdfG
MAVEDLSGRVVAVTGASSGIGEATGVALARAGAAVALTARREERIAGLANRIETEGGTAVALPADIADEDEARRFVEAASERLGRLDVLVNNAGVMLLGRVEGADTADWRRMVEVNLLGLLWCTHAALPIMREQGGGHIVNVSSVAGRVAGAGSAVYNMTKFGVHGFSEGLRQEALAANVRVTVIAPGFVDTELQAHNQPPVLEAIDRNRSDIGEVLRSADIADAIVYAVSRPAHVGINELLVRPTGQKR